MSEPITLSGIPFVTRSPLGPASKEYRVKATGRAVATVYVEADSPEEALVRAQRAIAGMYEEEWTLVDPHLETETLEEVIDP